MKKSFLFILAIAGMSLYSVAQAKVDVDDADEPSESVEIASKGGEKPHKSPEERAKHHSQKMKTELGLNQDQVDKVYKLALLRAQKMDQLRARTDSDKKAKHDQAKQIQVENDMALKADVLTPEQYSKYLQLKEEKKQKMQQKRGKK